MILATKSGWLIAVSVLRETPKAFIVEECDGRLAVRVLRGTPKSFIVKACDERRERRVLKDDTRQRLFDNTEQAIAWQEGEA